MDARVKRGFYEEFEDEWQRPVERMMHALSAMRSVPENGNGNV